MVELEDLSTLAPPPYTITEEPHSQTASIDLISPENSPGERKQTGQGTPSPILDSAPVTSEQVTLNVSSFAAQETRGNLESVEGKPKETLGSPTSRPNPIPAVETNQRIYPVVLPTLQNEIGNMTQKPADVASPYAISLHAKDMHELGGLAPALQSRERSRTRTSMVRPETTYSAPQAPIYQERDLDGVGHSVPTRRGTARSGSMSSVPKAPFSNAQPTSHNPPATRQSQVPSGNKSSGVFPSMASSHKK
jgi:hypothetical protein